MKTLIKALSLILCIVMMLSLVACNKDAPDDVPEGMKIATVPGHDFRLFVPTSWNANTAYGISGAYASLSALSNVSVVKYPVSAETAAQLPATALASKERLEWFYQNECLPTIAKITVAGTLAEVVAENATEEDREAAAVAMLDGEPARRYVQKGKIGESEIYFLHVLTERKDGEGSAFYVFEFVCDAQLYSRLITDVDKMLTAFIFSETPYQPDDYLKVIDTAAPAPEGMKLASNGEVAYTFYVPTSWEINPDERIFSAYVKENNRVLATVSVVPYMPDGASMSATELFAMSEDMMKATAGDGYTLLHGPVVNLPGSIKVLKFEETQSLTKEEQQQAAEAGNKLATAYHYTYTVGGVAYEYVQAIVVHKSMLYSVTYTARPEHFATYASDAEAILGAIVFR